MMERSFSEVSGTPWYINLPSRAILELFRAWMPSARPTSAMMRAALIFLISSACLNSRSRENAALFDADLDFVIAQIAGQAEGEIGGDKNLAQAVLAQEQVDDGGHAGPFDAVPPQPFQALAVGDDAAMAGAFARAVHLQVVDHGVALAVHAEVDERVGREQPTA